MPIRRTLPRCWQAKWRANTRDTCRGTRCDPCWRGLPGPSQRTCHVSRLSLTDGTPIYTISRLAKSSALRVTYSGNSLSPQEFSSSLLADPRDEILDCRVVDARGLS